MTKIYDILTWLQQWFVSQCNEEWEHEYGIKIDTIDNPGWSVTIDLIGTDLENGSMDTISIERSEDNWINCSVVDKQFKGYGGPDQLEEILNSFRAWIDQG